MGWIKKTVLTVIVIGITVGFIWNQRNRILDWALEKYFSELYEPFLSSPLTISGVNLNEDLRLQIQQIDVDWLSANGIYPFVIEDIQVHDSLIHFVSKKPVRITFNSLRPKDSSLQGLRGEAMLDHDAKGTMEIRADFIGVSLEELVPLNPENLTGTTGRLTGRLDLKTKMTGEQEFRLALKAEQPGGRLQARFFDILTPFLPAAQQKVIETVKRAGTVAYKEADVIIQKNKPASINLILHLLIPDYNLKLNLNVELRVESEDAFFELARLLGIVQGGQE